MKPTVVDPKSGKIVKAKEPRIFKMTELEMMRQKGEKPT